VPTRQTKLGRVSSYRKRCEGPATGSAGRYTAARIGAAEQPAVAAHSYLGGFVARGGITVHIWTRGDIERVRKLLPKIKNGRKLRYSDHDGIVWNHWTGALADLGVAPANALEAKTLRVNSQAAEADLARSRGLAGYKDFFALWNDADPDIPILKEVKAEYVRF
jgi:hypothetical protein